MLLLLQHSRTVLRHLASCYWWSWLSVPAPLYYHWRERPHVSFLLWQYFLWWQTSDNTCLLSRQKYACCDNNFVATKIFCRNFFFVMTNIIWLWRKFCCDKHTFVVTNTCLLWQNFCCYENDTCGSSCQWYLTAEPWNIFTSVALWGWCCVCAFMDPQMLLGWWWCGAKCPEMWGWHIRDKWCWADGDVGLNVLRCGADILGTNDGLMVMWG